MKTSSRLSVFRFSHIVIRGGTSSVQHRTGPQTSKATRLPLEILQLIISYLIPPAFEIERTNSVVWTHTNDPSHFNSNILRVCQISRAWYEAGIHLLYYRVVLCTLHQLERFMKALNHTPASRRIVRELIVFDNVLGDAPKRYEFSNGWRSWYYRTVTKRSYLKQGKRTQELARSIILICPCLQRVSVHCCSWAGMSSMSPFIFNGSEYNRHPALRQVLITESYSLSLCVPVGFTNLQTLTLLDTRISCSFLEYIPTGLPQLRTFTLIDSHITPWRRSYIYPLLRKIRSLRVLQLVDTGVDSPEDQITVAHRDGCPCPEGLERLSLVSSNYELDDILAAWSQLGGFPKTLRELRIPMFQSILPTIKLPPTLETLMLFLDPLCYSKYNYTPILEKIRHLLEQNSSTISEPTFMSVVVVTQTPTSGYFFNNWTSPHAMREERLLQELCNEYDVKLSKVDSVAYNQWFLHESER